MLLDVSRAMRQPGEAIPFEHHDEIPPQEFFGETITFDDVLLRGHFSGAEDNLRIWGTLTCTAHGHCAGCLKPVDLEMEIPFDENFLRLTRFTQQEETPEGEEIVARAESEGVYDGAAVRWK